MPSSSMDSKLSSASPDLYPRLKHELILHTLHVLHIPYILYTACVCVYVYVYIYIYIYILQVLRAFSITSHVFLLYVIYILYTVPRNAPAAISQRARKGEWSPDASHKGGTELVG